jgi:hypothetical protein
VKHKALAFNELDPVRSSAAIAHFARVIFEIQFSHIKMKMLTANLMVRTVKAPFGVAKETLNCVCRY